MNQYLLSPDGSFTTTRDEFIEIAPLITENHFKGQEHGFIVYSNANHIFAALILEEVTGQPLGEVMQQEVFGPLQMMNTAIDHWTLKNLRMTGCDVASGHRVCGDMTTVQPLSLNRSMSDTVEAATFGAYSCTHDIAKLLRELLKALDNASDLFTVTDARHIFGPKADHLDGAKTSLAGIYGTADSHVPGVESTNRVLSSDHPASAYRLGTLTRRRPCELYYKAGTIDGFTCSVYVALRFRSFVIVLANSSGPLDITDHIARYCLQEALDLKPRVDIVSKALDQRSWASQKVQKYEHDDSSFPAEHNISSDFVGRYVHSKYGQTIQILHDGEVRFGQEKMSTAMKAGCLGSVLRVMPGSAGFGIDRWSVWRELEYDLCKREGKLVLIRRGGSDEYEKVKEEGGERGREGEEPGESLRWR